MTESSTATNRNDSLTILRISMGLMAILLALTLVQAAALGLDFDIMSRSGSLIALYGVGMLGLASLLLFTAVLLFATWTRWSSKVTELFEAIGNLFTRLGRFNLVIFGIAIAVYAFLMIGPLQRFLGAAGFRWAGYLALVLGGTFLIQSSNLKLNITQCIVAALLVSASGYKIATFLPDLTNHPFSLGWSEGSRYYYASLYLSKQLYGFRIPPSVLHPSRYLMQAVPFLVHDSPIWLHRLWQILLWLGTTLGTVLLLVRRLNITQRFTRLMFILWVSLFLLLAPVYYHLQICAILILLAFDRRKPWRTLGVVLLASIWAGISRINWYPVPGMLAAALYFLEHPVSPESRGTKSPLRYLIPPALWITLGTATAFATQALYVIWSGKPADQFSSSFTSDLLWYRLFPSATYPLGILTGALLVFSPMLLLMLFRLRPVYRQIHPLRVLGTASILLVLFLGGLVVSIKIGGGSNLHNLDAFIMLFLVVFSYVYFNALATEPERDQRTGLTPTHSFVTRVLLGVTLCLPVFFTINQVAGYQLADEELVADSLATIQNAIDEASTNSGQVLFISERQLLMFGAVTGADMVPGYEKVFLMEMAMANNPAYLETFYEDLRNQRFDLIVSEPLKIIRQDRSHSFGEENNAWVKRVAAPILCYYEPLETMKRVRTELLVPRLDAGQCPEINQ